MSKCLVWLGMENNLMNVEATKKMFPIILRVCMKKRLIFGQQTFQYWKCIAVIFLRVLRSK